MDPLSQGVLASIAAQQVSKPKVFFLATVLGFLSGMAADLDVLIRSETDPLLALEFHRQFTHSLFFIPFGGLLCALFFSLVFRPWIARAHLSFRAVLLYCTAGYATHALLDACTTYGTQLFWPLSDMRVAWNTISIIDPMFTLPLLFFVIVAASRRSRVWSVTALCWCILYLSLGIIQRERAEAFAWQLAEQRGHQPLTLEAKPSVANLLVWKTVYSTETHFYVDAVRAGSNLTVYEGQSIKQLDLLQDFPWLDPESQQAIDVERFRWFSNGYIALSPTHSHRIIDIRYSLLPNDIKGLWGIELSPTASKEEHIDYVVDRARDKKTVSMLWSMILGR
jgi:inner membrane protein